MKLRVLSIITLALLLIGCGSRKKVVGFRGKSTAPRQVIKRKKPQKFTNKTIEFYSREYIRKFAVVAIDEMFKYKIPASITLAQGLLESARGRSELALKSNNHFGIKCHKGWQGQRVYYDDDRRNECFRKYKSPITSYEDHSIFLSSRKRYANLFRLKITDYKGWAKGLKKAGYATDRHYPQKLINLIEKYQLYKFDTAQRRGAERKENVPKKIAEPKNTYQVRQGDTLYSVAKRYNTTVEKLMKINNLKDTNISIGQILLIE